MDKKRTLTIIGITGGSGSGKTTFIRQLQETFSKYEICVISQDEYYIPRENQWKDDAGFENFDLPASLDLQAFHSDIQKVCGGETVVRKRYVFNNEASGAQVVTYTPAPVIILEGLFVFAHQPIHDIVDFKVFIHAKENLKVIRRIKRDQIERNYPVDVVLYRYEKHVMPAFDQHIKPYYENADIVINNNENFYKGLAILTGFIRNKLDVEK